MSYPRRGMPAAGGLGGMFGRPPPATMGLMVATFVLSVIAMGSGGRLGSGTLARLLLFSPLQVLEGWRVWTPFTYLFVETDPFSLLLHIAFPLWMFGATLERQWGPRRYLFYFFATGTGAAILTTALGMLIPSLAAWPAFRGTYVAAEALILAWVLMNWHATVYLLVFPIRAPYLLILVLGIPALYILQGQWEQFVPVLLGMGIGYLLMRRRGASPRTLWLHFRTWWIDRQLRKRARHLHVVPPPDKGERPDKKYLH